MISATVITLNEEENLARCLNSLKGWVDEIIVVDSGSTDKTKLIAREYGAKVFDRDFDNYAAQKNYALSKTTNEWILSIDADEEVEKELAGEIITKIQNTHFSGFTIPRKNIIFGKFIAHTRWNPELDRHVWLWKKQSGVWRGIVHEELEIKGEVGKLSNAKIHYQYATIAEFIDMVNRYSELDAFKIRESGKKFSYYNLIFQPIYNFAIRYIYRLGFLDGWRGFVLSYLMGVYHFSVQVKLWSDIDGK